VFLCFILFFLFCAGRLFFIQVFRSNYLAIIAKKQHNLFVELEPRRGTIYDSNLKPLAVNMQVDSLFACPNGMSFKDRETAAKKISAILGLNISQLRERLNRKKYFVWLARKITPQQSAEIRKLNIKGLDFIKESKRCYPDGYLASHVLGFAGLDNTGLEGLELYYDSYLKGEAGWAMFLRDARQKKLDLWEKMVLPKDGYDLVLTIDEVIQYIAERELDKAYRKYNAKGASIVVLDPRTGAVLALANRPTYDLNESTSVSRDIRRNRLITDMFEPGSVFKIVTASGALEEKKVDEKVKIFCENGAYKVSSHVLHDHRPHGWLTFREVIEQSSNIGTSKVAQMLGNDLLYKYIRLFGFGAKLGIDLPGEISGVARPPRFWSKVSVATIPMGHEIGVTTLQLAGEISIIANGGRLMKPYIVSEVRDKFGETIKQFSPVEINRVMSENTAERIKKILVGVIEEGTGKLAKVMGFDAAGKTGTAQKLEPNGRYSHNKYVASFIGFAPADEPLIAVAVTLDEPHPYYFGGVVAAPVFKGVANDAIRYLKTRQLPEEISVSHEINPVN